MPYIDLIFELPKTPFKNEASFTSWFGKKLRDQWGFWFKISDMDLRLKPADAIAAYKDTQYLVEIKISTNKKKEDVYNRLLPHQASWLKKYKDNGGEAIVIYYNKHHHKYWIYTYWPSITWTSDDPQVPNQ